MARTATKKIKPLNTHQLSVMRAAMREELKFKGNLKHHEVPLGSDRCVRKAIRDRGFATEDIEGDFFLTDEGRDRCRLPADVEANTTFEGARDASMWEHWNPEDES